MKVLIDYDLLTDTIEEGLGETVEEGFCSSVEFFIGEHKGAQILLKVTTLPEEMRTKAQMDSSVYTSIKVAQ